MRKLILFCLLATPALPQAAVLFEGRGTPFIPKGTAASPNPSATSVGAVTSLAINIAALNLNSVAPSEVQCWSGTGPYTPVTITNFSTTGSSPITTITPTFSSTANVTCTVNATGGAGAAGAAGAAGPAGPSGNFAPPYYTSTITASPMSITAVTHGQGVNAVGVCYDASTNPQLQADCQWARNPATGDLTLTYTVAPGAIQIGSGGAAASPLTTKGDLTGFSTAVARLPVGTNGQLLQADSTQALGVKYGTIALAGTPLTTRGDLLVANSTPAPARLALGAANTVLHGSATDPTYSAVVGGDFGSAIAARSHLANATAAAAAPSFSTTADALAYQTAEIPAYVFVTSSFTTSGVGTALEAITGLTWTMPGSTALNIPFHCALVYHQNSAAAAVAFGFQNATTGATNLLASGVINTSASVFAAANVANTTATTATAVVSGTPSAITTNWNATLDGLIEQPSGTASVFTIRVSTATAADTVTVLRGSYCRVG